jgi:hypothetical protein
MRALQIILLLGFAGCVLIVPYLIFSRIQDGGDNGGPVIFIAVIFAINTILIIRKLFNSKKEKAKSEN